MMKPQLAVGLLAVGSAIALACSSTNPSEVFGSLSIRGPEALRIGESTQFRAIRVRKDGAEEEVLAQWSVTSPYMTVQAANGIAMGSTAGVAELRASADGISAVEAVRVVPDMRGTWTGTAVFSCTGGNTTRLVGEGPTPFCKVPSFTNQTILGGPEQVGDTVAGVFTISGSRPGSFSGRVNIDSSWDWPDFTTTYFSSDGHAPHDFIFKGWRLTPQEPSGQMSGSGTVEQKFTNNWGYQHYRFTNVSMTLQRLQ